MSQETLNSLAIELLPLMIAAGVALYRFAVSMLPASKQQQLAQITSNLGEVAFHVVKSVEQTMETAPGADKKAQATNAIESILQSVGVKVAPELVNAAIESAVYSMNQIYTTPTPTPQPQSAGSSSQVTAPASAATIPSAG